MEYKYEYEGERSLFASKNIDVVDTKFLFGESPLKESRNINVLNSCFTYKYPLWYSKNIVVKNTIFEVMARSGIWYTNNIDVYDSIFECPKTFRRSKNINIENVKFNDASETFWNCNNIKLKNTYAKGDYFMMNSKNVEIDGLTLDGNYFFDGGSNLVIKNSKLNSKDAFWNCKNIKVIDCEIVGEYIGWNSSNITFINCKIESHQGFCYMKNVKLINCVLINTDLAFEYSTVDADIRSDVDSIKNPKSGKIVCKKCNEIILDDKFINVKDIKIIEENHE